MTQDTSADIKSGGSSWRIPVAVVVAGLLIGLAGWLLKWLIHLMTDVAMRYLSLTHWNLWLIAVPVTGILIVGFIIRRYIRLPLEQTTAIMRKDIAANNGEMPVRLTFSAMLMSAITLGFGGSAGSEGPIAYTGAAIGSNIGRFFRFSKDEMVVFLACGAGAGIAAIFKAPVGGIFFTIEVLGMTLGTANILRLTTMCLIAGLTAYALSGCTTDMPINVPVTFDYNMIPALLVLAVGCGIYSAYYLRTGLYMRKRLQMIHRPVVRNLVSGAAVGILLVMFPAMYGEGYHVLSTLANGNTYLVTNGSITMTLTHEAALPLALTGILLFKSIACYSSNSGGGVAGDFAPTLFAGGLAGALIAVIVTHLPFLPQVSMTTMVVCGMAAVMSGVVRAPLMTIFLVTEMTHTNVLLLPVAVVSFISFVISRMIQDRIR